MAGPGTSVTTHNAFETESSNTGGSGATADTTGMATAPGSGTGPRLIFESQAGHSVVLTGADLVMISALVVAFVAVIETT